MEPGCRVHAGATPRRYDQTSFFLRTNIFYHLTDVVPVTRQHVHTTTHFRMTTPPRKQALALRSNLTLATGSHWGLAGHPRYTSASTEGVCGWVTMHSTGAHMTVYHNMVAGRGLRASRPEHDQHQPLQLHRALLHVNPEWIASFCYVQGDWGLGVLVMKRNTMSVIRLQGRDCRTNAHTHP